MRGVHLIPRLRLDEILMLTAGAVLIVALIYVI
jgi:hypothetical protein